MERLHFAQTTIDSQEQANANLGLNGNTSDNFLWKLLLLSTLAYFVWTDKFAVVLDLTSSAEAVQEAPAPVKASFLSAVRHDRNREPAEQAVMVELPPGDMTNLTLAIDPGFARRYSVPQVEQRAHQEACNAYVKRFAPVAVAEMRKYGIPASITLAQGLLESNAGESRLAQKANNHFGLKCFSRKCKKGHCINQTDDSHKDFFVVYPNVWGSFRAHSEMLSKNKRYNALFEASSNDYKSWATGLEKCGYASDPMYAEKLMAIIQNLKLHRFD